MRGSPVGSVELYNYTTDAFYIVEHEIQEDNHFAVSSYMLPLAI